MTVSLDGLAAELERVKGIIAAHLNLDMRSDEQKAEEAQAAADAEKALTEAPPATPAAAALAEDKGVDLTTVEPTGASGQVVVADVKAADAPA